ncbi:MAG: hypothetical protein CTY15_01670 [Methylocystis sp.]|nr:MAG: hypothetical protein CTY15_01670 [Methylocystis sp.]
MKSRLLTLFASAIAMTPTFANEITVVTESAKGRSTATIMQSGPAGEQKPALDVQSGPGYVIVKQRGQSSRAVIFQGNGATDGR